MCTPPAAAPDPCPERRPSGNTDPGRILHQKPAERIHAELQKNPVVAEETSVQELGQIKVPSLIIVGNQFGSMFVKINKKIADAVEGSKFVVLDNSMDPSPLVNPRDFNDTVLSFLEDNTSNNDEHSGRKKIS